MKIKILLLTILFYAFNAIYADDHIQISGMEAIQCNFEEGKDMDDVMKVMENGMTMGTIILAYHIVLGS